MRHQVVWAACSVTNPETGEDKILAKGDMLPAWVDEFTRFVLASSGAVKVVEGEEPDPAPAEALPDPVRLPEHPPPVQQSPEPATQQGEQAKPAEAGKAPATSRAAKAK
jgi:hypothetical protein